MFRETGTPVKKEPFESLTVDDVFGALREEDSRKLILIIDEFDRVEDPDIDAMFADTIKVLSDFDLDTTLILVGVADDVDDLITEHESVDRCLVQIHLPRMPFEEMMDIVRSGVGTAGMEASDEAVSGICAVSWGCRTMPMPWGSLRGERPLMTGGPGWRRATWTTPWKRS